MTLTMGARNPEKNFAPENFFLRLRSTKKANSSWVRRLSMNINLKFARSVGVGLVFASMIAGSIYSMQSGDKSQKDSTISITSIEQRISNLENKQETYVRTIEKINEQNSGFVSTISVMMGIIIFFLTVFTSIFTILQYKRDNIRYQQQIARDNRIDNIELTGVQKTSKVLDIIQKILNVQRDSGEISNQNAKKYTDHIADYKNIVEENNKIIQKYKDEIASIIQFKNLSEGNRKNEINRIENSALELVKTRRHEFKSKTVMTQLAVFASYYDDFNRRTSTNLKEFTARVWYIRGLSAHYLNQPDLVDLYLKMTVGKDTWEESEDKVALNKRHANAYYCLGIMEFNFGRNSKAVSYFKQAIEIDKKSGKNDLLTRIALAEAYIMDEDFNQANDILNEIKLEYDKLNVNIVIAVETKLYNRAELIRANILLGQNEKEKAREVLQQLYTRDPKYYFATATLGQIEPSKLERETKFREAYETIINNIELDKTTEKRSKVLLMMVVGLCCKNIPEHIKETDIHLNKALELLQELPKMGNEKCTVYSTMTKFNVNEDKIKEHIEAIRSGKLILIG
jgi:tetratricopeptide (TPR) repeat protein